MRTTVLFPLLIAALGVGTWTYMQRANADTVTAPASGVTTMVTVSVPDSFAPLAEMGKIAFDAKCAICHGENAAGQKGVAPPLVHKIYEPSHHGDFSFERAAMLGVRAHHWPFGDMPPVEGLTKADIKSIIAYIRALQRENGIS